MMSMEAPHKRPEAIDIALILSRMLPPLRIECLEPNFDGSILLPYVRSCITWPERPLSAREDVAQLQGMGRIAPPIKLDFTQALIAVDRGTEIGTRRLGRACSSAYRIVDRDADRRGRQV